MSGAGSLIKKQQKFILAFYELIFGTHTPSPYDLQSFKGLYGRTSYVLLLWTTSKHPSGCIKYFSPLNLEESGSWA